jgi:hypothetical protein
MKKLSVAFLTLLTLLSLSSIALMVSASADPTSQENSTDFTAQLSGDQEVPPRTTVLMPPAKPLSSSEMRPS